MSYCKTIRSNEATGVAFEIFKDSMNSFGFIPKSLNAFAIHPLVLELNYKSFVSSFHGKTILPDNIKKMIALLVSGINKCDYSINAHSFFMEKEGFSQEEISNLLKLELKDFDRKTELLLGYIAKASVFAHRITPQDVISLQEAEWTDEEIIEAVHIMGLFNGLNRMMDAIGLKDAGIPGVV